MRPLTILLLLSTFLLSSCGGNKRVMETGFLQKRKHLPGWDLSFGKKDRSIRPIVVDVSRVEAEPSKSKLISPDLSTSIGPIHDRIDLKDERFPVQANTDETLSLDHVIQKNHDLSIADPDQQETELPKKKWNKFAIPAFVAALVTLYLGFFGTSTIAVIIALAVTFILSGISLRQIRSRDEAGKGFAIAALMIGVIAAVVTAIVTYAIGFI